MVKKSIKIFKEDSHCLCLLVILIDFVFKMGKNYYQQVLLEECKYIVKEKKISKFITDELEISSDESDYYDHPDEKYIKTKYLTSQLSRFYHVSHSFSAFLMVSW